MTCRLTFGYGNHLSIIIAGGFWGRVGNFSIITFRGGGGSFLPLFFKVNLIHFQGR